MGQIDGDSIPRVAVIGGGPAGLIAAEHLSASGLQVDVWDHMRTPARKFLLAGRSGLNLTHECGETDFGTRDSDDRWFDETRFDRAIFDFAKNYGEAADFFLPLLHNFGPRELREWSAELGQTTFVGTSGRVFPESMRAAPLLRAWLGRLSGNGVKLKRAYFRGLVAAENQMGVDLELPTGERVTEHYDAVVLALGGASWPRTGSDGAWPETLRIVGVDVAPLEATNCGVTVDWPNPLPQGLEWSAVKNVRVRIDVDDSEQTLRSRGDLMVTPTGLEGSPIYALVRHIREHLPCELRIDLKPGTTESQLLAKLAKAGPKASTANKLRKLNLSPQAIALLKTCSSHTSVNSEIARLIKNLPISITALAPIDRAISSAGGISLEQLTSTLMVRDLPGVFAAGEMLDWEAPTGGYLLQGCFSTGAAAAAGVQQWLRQR